MANIILDFDSTISSVELLPEIFKVALQGNKKADEIQKQIEQITSEGMSGEISFPESLKKRIDLLPLTKDHIKLMVKHISVHISPSFKECVSQLAEHNLHIISGAFSDVIVPLMAEYGVFPYQIHANKFTFDDEDKFTGVDVNSLLTQENGKVKVVKSLNLNGKTVVIGDGFTDLQIKERGLAEKFIYYAEHVQRENVMSRADFVAKDFHNVLQIMQQLDL
ncbi:HAD-IB family phosphatase [candidate division WWE3 bacterium]|uniref:phosphoserine phosphatase n=1 Tax=candidate division WWE3 bacterium TaxID=2053526 RepID=A0A955RSG1_UNCKA|nr:HAD-IB family phosphatase [candidate division WWE3 bacterium]